MYPFYRDPSSVGHEPLGNSRVGSDISHALWILHGRAIMTPMTSSTAFFKGQFTQSPEFEQSLDRLAEIAVQAGLGLAQGQELVMTATLDGFLSCGASRSTPTKQEPPSSRRCIPTNLRLYCDFAMVQPPASRPHHHGSMKVWPKHSGMAQRGSRSPAMIHRYSRRKIRKR